MQWGVIHWPDRSTKNSKMPLLSRISGISGPENVAELLRKHDCDISTCARVDAFIVGDFPHNDRVVIRPDEPCYAVEKSSLNKASAPDQITAEHLKYASSRVFVWMAWCFTGLLMHGALPDSILTLVLVPVVEVKAGKLSSVDNYRSIALASALSKVLEHILLDKTNMYYLQWQQVWF